MPTLVADSFNRADSSSTLGTADTGQAWTAHNSTWGISSNQAVCVSSDGGAEGQSIVEVNAGGSDVTVQCTAVVKDNDGGLCGRVSDDANFFFLTWGSAGGMNLYRMVAGTFTNITGDVGDIDDGDVVKWTFFGSDIKVFINSEVSPRISVTDSFNQSSTRFGMRASIGQTSMVWDDFQVVGTALAEMYPSGYVGSSATNTLLRM